MFLAGGKGKIANHLDLKIAHHLETAAKPPGPKWDIALIAEKLGKGRGYAVHATTWNGCAQITKALTMNCEVAVAKRAPQKFVVDVNFTVGSAA